MPIINSLMDNDFYTFTVGQLLFHQHPNVTGTYRYKCRSKHNKGIPTSMHPDTFLGRFWDEVDALCDLRFSEPELKAFEDTGHFQPGYLELLRQYKPSKDGLEIGIDKDGALAMTIHGNILDKICFEVPLLAINSELNSKGHGRLYERGFVMAEERLAEKIDYIHNNASDGFNFIDFGTRRRYSALWHDRVIETLVNKLKPGIFAGTSNCMLAMKYGVPMVGTQSHQLYQVEQALVGPKESVRATLEDWYKEYAGELSIALSDIFGFDHFLRYFIYPHVHNFLGARHDSSDPYEWCTKLINHYEDHNIDSRTKMAVFSDGLDFRKAIYLYKAFADQIGVSFGIGTNLTNDTGLIDALQIVIKLIEVNGKSVAKISDDGGKGMCEDLGYVGYVKHVCRLNI